MEDYAGRVLADRYRLPLPPAEAYEFAETRAFDTYSGQEVLVRQVPLPEVVEAEVVGDEGFGDGDLSDVLPGGLPDGFRSAGSAARGARGERSAGARATRRPSDPAVRRAIEAAQAAARVPDHPRLDQVFDVFAEDGSLWIVSELVAARPLVALLADKPLNPFRAAEVAADVVTALRVLHAHGWVHRNITARTVLVCDDGRVLLTGLAAGAAEEALCGYDPRPEGEDFSGFAEAPAVEHEDAPEARDALEAPGARAAAPHREPEEGDAPAREYGNRPAPGTRTDAQADYEADLRAARAGAIAAYRAGAARAATRVTGPDAAVDVDRGPGDAEAGRITDPYGVRGNPYGARENVRENAREKRPWHGAVPRTEVPAQGGAHHPHLTKQTPPGHRARHDEAYDRGDRPVFEHGDPYAHERERDDAYGTAAGGHGPDEAYGAAGGHGPDEAYDDGYDAYDGYGTDGGPEAGAGEPYGAAEGGGPAREGGWGDPAEGRARRGPATALAAERARHARMTVVGPVTERWAPEQAGPVHENWQLAAPIGPATDLWALGALLFRAVQGHAPYPEESTADLVQLVCAEPPAFAEECGPLRPVVESLLRQDPTERIDFEELSGWLRSLVRSAPEPDAGVHVVPAPPYDGGRLPVVRRRGEVVRKRRAPAPVATGGGHGRHKRGRDTKPVRVPRPERTARPARGPRSLGRVLLLVILAGLVAAVAYALLFMPKADENEGAGRTGNAGRTSAAPGGGPAGDDRPDEDGKPGGDQGQEEGASPRESPDGGASPGSQEPQTTAPDLEPGFALRKDAEGFRVAVASGWDRQPKNGRGQVLYTHGKFELLVVPGRDSTGDFGTDPMKYQKEDERELQPFRDSSWATSSGMRRVDVGGRAMAEGQFTWQGPDGTEVFVRNLALIVDGAYHVVQVRGPEAERDEVDRLYEQAAKSYQAVR
ncbi:protein kinase [Streptomyces sp. CC224B]|uniref:protein kinase n=1 Tax=Streptomyces sp. CC224B TaxID=3044571 RepID=UPI0024A7ECB1|nr:protein kinase [Streptomyces sp. CC224B]